MSDEAPEYPLGLKKMNECDDLGVVPLREREEAPTAVESQVSKLADKFCAGFPDDGAFAVTINNLAHGYEDFSACRDFMVGFRCRDCERENKKQHDDCQNAAAQTRDQLIDELSSRGYRIVRKWDDTAVVLGDDYEGHLAL